MARTKIPTAPILSREDQVRLAKQKKEYLKLCRELGAAPSIETFPRDAVEAKKVLSAMRKRLKVEADTLAPTPEQSRMARIMAHWFQLEFPPAGRAISRSTTMAFVSDNLARGRIPPSQYQVDCAKAIRGYLGIGDSMVIRGMTADAVDAFLLEHAEGYEERMRYLESKRKVETDYGL